VGLILTPAGTGDTNRMWPEAGKEDGKVKEKRE
jgi:hypothetical protein